MYDPGMFWAVFGAAWVFGCVIVCIVIWHLRSKRNIEKQKLIHEERMRAMEKGIPLPEFSDLGEEARMDPINRIFTSRLLHPKWPLGVGVLSIMAGAGYMVSELLDSNEYSSGSEGWIPIFVGIGFMLFYRLTRTTDS